MNARISTADVMNTFNYKRAAVKITAYGKEYELPVRTTEFCDKQDKADRKIADTSGNRTSADVVAAIKEGIAIFIGADEVERIFPAEKVKELDIDEITVFYNYLKDRSLQNLVDYTKKYAPNRLKVR
ncbi:MAG: hypothetical protein ACI4XF_10175 [Oscillospiraceae bacterium]